MSRRSMILALIGLPLLGALLSGVVKLALAQSTGDDLSGAIGMISTYTVTDPNGKKTTHLTIDGSFGEASFVLDDKQTRDLLGDANGGFSLNVASLAPLYATHLKDALGLTDDEWKLLSPKIMKVRRLSLHLSSHGRSGQGPGGSELTKAWSALNAVVAKKDSKPEDIQAAMRAVDLEEGKVKAELEEARKDLQQLLTVKQEAFLVKAGILE